jgi:hypothetical protein
MRFSSVDHVSWIVLWIGRLFRNLPIGGACRLTQFGGTAEKPDRRISGLINM